MIHSAALPTISQVMQSADAVVSVDLAYLNNKVFFEKIKLYSLAALLLLGTLTSLMYFGDINIRASEAFSNRCSDYTNFWVTHSFAIATAVSCLTLFISVVGIRVLKMLQETSRRQVQRSLENPEQARPESISLQVFSKGTSYQSLSDSEPNYSKCIGPMSKVTCFHVMGFFDRRTFIAFSEASKGSRRLTYEMLNQTNLFHNLKSDCAIQAGEERAKITADDFFCIQKRIGKAAHVFHGQDRAFMDTTFCHDWKEWIAYLPFAKGSSQDVLEKWIIDPAKIKLEHLSRRAYRNKPIYVGAGKIMQGRLNRGRIEGDTFCVDTPLPGSIPNWDQLYATSSYIAFLCDAHDAHTGTHEGKFVVLSSDGHAKTTLLVTETRFSATTDDPRTVKTWLSWVGLLFRGEAVSVKRSDHIFSDLRLTLFRPSIIETITPIGLTDVAGDVDDEDE